MLSIYREFLSDRIQRVVVDDASCEWIPITSDVPQGSVLGPLPFIQYTIDLSWLRTHYMPIQITPHYRQLSASQQTALLLMPLFNMVLAKIQ